MNFGLRSAQIDIEDRKRMNIVERSAEAFRYARNSQSPREDGPEENTTIEAPEPEWARRQWYIVNQLKAQVLFLSSKINEMRANASKKTNDYL